MVNKRPIESTTNVHVNKGTHEGIYAYEGPPCIHPHSCLRFSMALYEPFVIVEDSQNRFADFKTHENGDHVGVAEGLNITTSTFTTISSSLSLRNGGDCVFNSTTTEKVPVPKPSISQG